jgi:hypothetical protein
VIVIFDTNIWYSQLGLKSPSSAAVRFFLRHHGAKVAIPEVVRLEVTHNLSKRLLQHIDSIRSEYRQLLTAFGRLHELVLPTEPEVSARIDDLFSSLGVDVLDVPFSLESARSSFLKTISKLPPSQATQQFKDGVLWADCLSLSRTDEVVLVTDDRAFYEDQKPTKGLAQSLQEEVGRSPYRIRVLPTLTDLLDAIRTPISLEPDELQQAFLAVYGESVYAMLERAEFGLGARTEASLKPFATEHPSVLFVEFSIAFDCFDLTAHGRTGALLRLSGDCSFEPESHTFGQIRSFGEHLQFRMPDGTVADRRNLVVFADSAVLGHRIVTDVTRYPLVEE